MDAAKRGVFVRMFSSALASQALLSAASFLVALLLIRRTSDLQYGYFILVSGAIILVCSLQNSFIGPVMINRMTRLTPSACGDLTGGLYREQRRVIIGAASAALAGTLALWMTHLLDGPTLLLMVAAIAAAAAAMRREFFRMVLLAYRRAYEVLRGDLIYAFLLTLGVLLATFSSAPAAASVLTMCIAGLIAAQLLSHDLRRTEAWNTQGASGLLRQIAPLGAWSAAGAAVHWSFSQGYAFLVAATLDVSAIAAVAATRLLVMPLNLLSSGIGSLMLPLASRWLHEHGASLVLRRLVWFALGIVAASACYFAVLWVLRDWVFEVVMNKQFAQSDLLLMLWSAGFALMAVNQQLLNLLIARERFHRLTSLGIVSAVLGLSCSYWGIQRFGGAGAPLGILIGEFVSTIGITILCLRETAMETGKTPTPPAQSAPLSLATPPVP